MNEILQKEEIVRIINDKLVIDTGTDWIAIFALIISITALIWQYCARKKEDKIRQWNALYPHRLEFYANFYDTLYRFVYYAPVVGKIGKASLAGRIEQKTISTRELCEYGSLFNRYAEEAKILFNKDISERVHKVYEIIQYFINHPFYDSGETIQDLDEEIKSVGNTGPIFNDLAKSLKQTQDKIWELKWDTDLRNRFIRELKLEGNKDE